ncbi:MAG: glycosyltransferase family 4 protein [Desulfobacteraceae bacterium]|nr:glycosyltransferase family 4 protein [Desulfobacteraceae bacterium]
MHILIISQYFWPENFRINELSLSLKKKGHQVTVLTGQPNYPEGNFLKGYGFFKKNRENYDGVNIIRVPIIPRGRGSAFRLIINYLSFVLSAGILGPAFCHDKYDVIFVYEPSPVTIGISAIVMKKIKRVPIMFWVQDLWPETLSAVGVIRSKTILKIVGWMVRFIYSQCDRILIQSKSFRSSVEKYTSKPESIFYFPNSAEELYQPLNLKADVSEGELMPSDFRVMFAGNIGAAQGFVTILDAASLLKEHKKIHWVILGDGRIRPWVEDEIKKRGLEETFHLLGKHPIETMPRFFSFADALLVTLKKDPIFSLTIPAKLQSYLACGRPVIAALDGAGAEVVEESKSGLVCPPDDSNKLAKAVLEMYSMPEENRKRMGKDGRKYFETFFEGKMLINKLETWMKEVAETREK